MGQCLSGRCQALHDGVWVTLPIEIDSVRHEKNVGWRNLVGQPNRGHLGYVQYDFLVTGDGDYFLPPFIKPRGIPDGYVETLDPEGYKDHPELPSTPVTWFTLEEFLEFPWDEFYFGGFTARQLVGQPFIDYFQSLKDQGAERVVLWVN